ncbi:hypothetical protein CAP35_10770 [Chitinophagaceae bacterium IBVUCB1]|nr:hypothetical protein CAP35_10770 [Chitinophagaceae bacterium IBVUCB1]
MNFIKRSVGKVIAILFCILPFRLVRKLVSLLPSLAKFVPKDKLITVTIDNSFFGKMRLLLNTGFGIDSSIIHNGYYELKTMLYLQHIIKEGDVCIDIGANVGAITFPLSKLVKETGHVYAFEPGPALHERLVQNIQYNNIKNVELFRCGLGNQNTTLYWDYVEGQPGNANLSTSGKVKVDVKRLDDISPLFSRKINFIKIDVEGMELEVIMGGLQLIQSNLPIIFYESLVYENLSDGQFEKQKQIIEVLSGLGYATYEIDMREEDLKLDSQLRFIPTYFPKLPANTLAVHSSKIDRIGL